MTLKDLHDVTRNNLEIDVVSAGTDEVVIANNILWGCDGFSSMKISEIGSCDFIDCALRVIVDAPPQVIKAWREYAYN